MNTRASRMLGNAVTASLMRISASSSQPPKYPVKAPTSVPTAAPMHTVAALMKKVVPAPASTRLKMSRPKLSVPNRCRRHGARNFSLPDMAVGE